MILQALVRYYEALARRGDIARPGWSPVKVSFALEIDDEGHLLQLCSLKTEQQRGKKTVLMPQEITLPTPVKRTVGVESNFLCDNASYMLCVDAKGNRRRTHMCYDACRARHEAILQKVDTPAARAVLAFFAHWDPDGAEEHPALAEDLKELLAGGNLLFRYHGIYVHEDEAIRAAWQDVYGDTENSLCAVCLVTGQEAPVATLHPSVKGVAGAQAVGASLVSFNAPSACSYGKEQGHNAPTSQYAAFAYGAALNHLLSQREHVVRFGDTTMVCWAENGDPRYQDAMAWQMGAPPHENDTDVYNHLMAIVHGRAFDFDKVQLDPDEPFYILGLAPNAGRLSVRFFLRNTFGGFLKNIGAHDRRLEIVRPVYDEDKPLTFWQLLNETVNQNSRDKSPAPLLAGETLRAILNGTHYPATLLGGVVLRIRADREMNWRRAAIIKAYYLKNLHPDDTMREVLTVALNANSTNIAYNLGRLFAILERIQIESLKKDNPGKKDSEMNTIRSRYFSSASATPSLVFPALVNLSQAHMKKILRDSTKIWLSNLQMEVTNKLDESYPARLTLQEQGSFQLGYYHQTQAFYLKKEDETHE